MSRDTKSPKNALKHTFCFEIPTKLVKMQRFLALLHLDFARNCQIRKNSTVFQKIIETHVDFTRNCQIRDNSTFFTMLDLSHVDFTRKILQSDSTISFKIKRVFEQL